MTIPRRTFLRDAFRSSLTVGLLIVGAKAGFGQTGTDGTIPLEAQKDPVFLFTASTFGPYVGGYFQAPNARGEMIEMVLLKVQKFTAKNRLTKLARPCDSFTLTFKAAAELPPFTSIHTISHPALGKFDLFLTKRKNDRDELFYEAVINHVQ